MAFNTKHLIFSILFVSVSMSLPLQAIKMKSQNPLESEQSETLSSPTRAVTHESSGIQDLNVLQMNHEKPNLEKAKHLELEPWKYETISDKIIILLPSVVMGGHLLMISSQTLNPLELVSGAALGMLGADLTSGTLHCIGDFASDDEPNQNPSLATKIIMTTFRSAYRHHDNPQNLLKMSYWEKTRGFNIMLIPVLGTATLWGGWGGYTLAIGAVFLANCEVFHSLAHKTPQEENFLVKKAKSRKLILNRELHNVHHYGDEAKGIKPFTQNFCLIQGHIANKLLNPVVSFFLKLCGSRVKNEIEDKSD